MSKTQDQQADPTHTSERMSLTMRIAAMLTLALLPLGLIAVFQSLQAIETARDTYRESLSAQTFRAASPEGGAIVNAFGMARGLADALPSLIDAPEDCVAAMRRTVFDHDRVTFAGFVDLAQQSECNSDGVAYDFSDNPENDRVFAAQERDVTFNPSGAATDTAVVIVSQPVLDERGTFLGFVSLSFPSIPLIEARARAGVDEAVTLVTFNDTGAILTADMPRDRVDAVLPATIDLADLVGRGQQLFAGRSNDGTERDFAVVPIVPGKVYALGSWEAARPFGQGGMFVASSVVFPMLMWLASLVVSILALRRLVILPVRTLRMRMRSFADGRSLASVGLTRSAPRELREIGDSFERMAFKITRDEADLEDKVHEREVLLREVHHRVKNNLQLMSSIINMQIRQSRTDEAEDALRRVQGRLASLAKFHQDLYETSSLSQLRADQLLEDLARQMIGMSADPLRQVDLRLEFDEITLTPDQSSPLAMLATEALTNALKYAGADGDSPVFVALSLKRAVADGAEWITLGIENSVASEVSATGEEGLGTRLITAFASQLDAQVEREEGQGRYALSVRFQRVAQVQPTVGTEA
ncbi:MAG: histidine kinase dimerization/phosphoacceptor domain -containing protein [Pseudomonadota bacterium]